MKTYAQLRRLRYEKYLPKYENLIERLERAYMDEPHVYEPTDTTRSRTVAAVQVSTALTPELNVFLKDYMWLTGIPITFGEKDGGFYVIITDEDTTNTLAPRLGKLNIS